MGDIYQNAAVTIAATSPADSRSSLLAAETTSVPTATNSAIVARLPMVVEALHRRAWAFQEYLMSHRVIDFSSESVSFHCGSGTRQKAGRTEMSSLIDSSKNGQLAVKDLMYQPFGFRYLWTHYFCLTSLTKSQLDISNILVWGRIVNMYTFRDITRGTDRLPALSGLASFYLRRAEPDEEYLAGLWRNDFTYCLGWGTESLGTMPRAHRAPSWSWASVDAIITYFSRYNLPSWRSLVSKIVIRDVCCKLKGINPFGQVVDGFAVVTGPAVDLNMEIVPDEELNHCSCFLSHGLQGTKKRFNSDIPLAPTCVKNGIKHPTDSPAS